MRSYREDSLEVAALAAARGIRRAENPPGDETQRRSDDQMRLFAIEGGARPRRRRTGRNARMADRLDQIAVVAEREEAAARRQGSDVDARRARERAQDARRAAAMLRAGPQGVGGVLAS